MTKHFFLYRTGAFGDSIVSIPAIRKLRSVYPDHQLHLIYMAHQKGVITPWQYFKTSGFFTDHFPYSNSLSSLFSLAKRIRMIKGEKRCIYLPANKTPLKLFRDYLFLRFLCGFKDLKGLKETPLFFANKFLDSRFITKKGFLPDYAPQAQFPLKWLPSESKRLYEVICSVTGATNTFSEEAKPPYYTPTTEETKKAKDLLTTSTSSPVYIALDPFAKVSAKVWPEPYFIELIKALVSTRPNLVFVILAGQNGVRFGNELNTLFPNNVINLSGKTSLTESCAVLNFCSLFIGNDSGVMHLAASMGCPTFSIFSSRTPFVKWDPIGHSHTIIRKDIACSGCELNDCVTHKTQCLTELTPTIVTEKVQEKLSDLSSQENKLILI